MPASEYLNFKRSKEVLDEEERRKRIINLNYKHIANMNGQIVPIPLNNAEFFSKYGYVMEEYLKSLQEILQDLENESTIIYSEFLKNFNKLMLIYNSPLFNETDKKDFRTQLENANPILEQIITQTDEIINERIKENEINLNSTVFSDSYILTLTIAILQKNYIAQKLYKIISTQDILTEAQKYLSSKNIKLTEDERKYEEEELPQQEQERIIQDEEDEEDGGDDGNFSFSFNLDNETRRQLDDATDPNTLANDIMSSQNRPSFSPQGFNYPSSQSALFTAPILDRGYGEIPALQSGNLTSGMSQPPNPAVPHIPQQQPPPQYIEVEPRNIDIDLEPQPQSQPVNPPPSRSIFEQIRRNVLRNEEEETGRPRPPPKASTKTPAPKPVSKATQGTIRRLLERQEERDIHAQSPFRRMEGQGKKNKKKSRILDKEQIDMLISKINQPAKITGKQKKIFLNNNNQVGDLEEAKNKSFMFNK